MFPGTASDVVVTFTSNQNLNDISIEIPPSLNGIASATPASFASIIANQPYQVTLTMTAPPHFIEQDISGMIQIGNMSDPSIAQPLAINLQTRFLSFDEKNIGVSFFFPLMDASVTVLSVSGTTTTPAGFDVSEFDGVINHFVQVVGITVNPLSGLTFQQWFEANVDDASGSLLAFGGITQQLLPDGYTAFFLNTPIPAQYSGAPISGGAWVVSPISRRVLTLAIPQDSALADFPTSPYRIIGTSEEEILGSMKF